MSHPVFLSYARRTSTGPVTALHKALGDSAFLDTEDIGPGDRFPQSRSCCIQRATA